jgi:penicillin-binding protein 2
VVNEGGGTGVRARLPYVQVCGKTGTAQVASAEYERAHKGAVKDNGWFVAYAPCYKPEIVISVLWENSGLQGAFAAPIERDVMVAYFNKKERLAEAAKIKASPASSLTGMLLPPVVGSR